MEIKNLSNTNLEPLVACLLKSFEGYFVQMPADVNYWKERFTGARVDFQLSFGVFDNSRLVAFIINGIDRHNGDLTAFNTGTGVLPEYRGQKLVDRLYEFAIPFLKTAGVTRCSLEVIEGNERAIKVYERIGFKITRSLHCFKGVLKEAKNNYHLRKKDFTEIMTSDYKDEKFYSWDHCASAIIASGTLYDTFVLQNDREMELGYFTINSRTGYLVRIEKTELGNYEDLIDAVGTISRQIKMNNLDQNRKELSAQLVKAGLTNFINQLEMEKYL